MKTIDCRGMACPQPVVTVRRALDEPSGEGVTVYLDDGAARENVRRFAISRGCSVDETVEGGWCSMTISRPEQGEVRTGACEGERRPTVMLIASDRLGEGSEELGRLLMKNFIITLLDLEGKSVAEICTLTGWGASRVKVTAWRVRRKLGKTAQRLRLQEASES